MVVALDRVFNTKQHDVERVIFNLRTGRANNGNTAVLVKTRRFGVDGFRWKTPTRRWRAMEGLIGHVVPVRPYQAADRRHQMTLFFQATPLCFDSRLETADPCQGKILG